MQGANNSQDQMLGDISSVSLPSMGSGQPQGPQDNNQPSQPMGIQPAADNSKPAASNGADSNDDLLEIKQKALDQLGPVVNHLDLPLEEKFRTTMMMIQASDDQSLIPQAYEAAQAITDEKEKAQALLDVINEINYFSQKDNN